MANIPDYICSSCGREVGKDNLKVKRAVFREVGKGGSVVKTRTVGWLCIISQPDGEPSCLDQDPDWNRPLYSTSPGMKGTILDQEVSGGDENDEPLFPPMNEVMELDERLRRSQ